jgi:hypothetical protein
MEPFAAQGLSSPTITVTLYHDFILLKVGVY